MSYLTRCPACATAFRLEPAQLEMAQGWVRCGQCQQVYDARVGLQPYPVPADDPVALPLRRPEAGADDWPEAPLPEAAPTQPPMPGASPPDAPLPEADPDKRATAALHDAGDATTDSVAVMPVEATADAGAPVADASGAEAPEADGSLTAEELGFMRRAQRRAFWQRPAVRGLLMLLVLLALLVLALQIVLPQREAIAARQPALLPALQTLCEIAGCRIEPLRRIDALALDSSGLWRRGGADHVFDAVIQNRSDLPLAMPAIELVITDAGDQPLVRRVFPPADWPGAPSVLPAGGEWPLRLELSLDPGLQQGMSGYRALLFYP